MKAVFDGGRIGCGDFKNPSDFYYRDGKLYVLDSGNGRIVAVDGSFSPVGEYKEFVFGGERLTLSEPEGIFIAPGGDLYIADTGNKRVIQSDSKGVVKKVITQPENPVYPKEIQFQPIKVLADSLGDVYVLVKGMYYGAVRFNAHGVFKDFYGSNKVQATAAQMVEKMWKSILTKTQRKYIANYVPVYFNNFDIDEKDFIYTVTSGSGTLNEIKKNNTVGANVLAEGMRNETINRSDYGDKDKLSYGGKYYDSKLEDIDIAEGNYINTLDITRNRVFRYDQDSNLLFVFGGTGSQKGLFKKAVAVETIGDTVLVLDYDKANITVFEPNIFADAVHSAVGYYSKGYYEEAIGPWREVLKYNANFDTAYIGIGKALAQQQKHEEALAFFKLGFDRGSYSQSYKLVRAEKLQRHFGVFVSALAAAGLLLVFRAKIRNAVRKRLGKPVYAQSTESPFYVMKHPVEGFDDIRRTNKNTVLLSSVAVAFFCFVSQIAKHENTGFIFNLNRSGSMKLGFLFLQTFGLLLLFVLSNWAVSIFLNGDGVLKRIWIVSAYSLLPFALCGSVSTLLSNFTVLEENALLAWISMLGILWSAFLLFNGIKEVHQYSGGQTIASILFSLLGVLFCLFVLVLSITLVRQLILFVSTMVSEVLLRTV